VFSQQLGDDLGVDVIGHAVIASSRARASTRVAGTSKPRTPCGSITRFSSSIASAGGGSSATAPSVSSVNEVRADHVLERGARGERLVR